MSPNRTHSPGAAIGFAFDNSYARELAGAFVFAEPSPAPDPRLIWLNEALAVELQLDARALAESEGVAILAGNALPAGAQPLAQAYAGHQFGGFSPQLGDGRALLLGELIDRQGRRRDIAFKGSGRTVFSRGGDGKAALGPVLREVLIGEAMHALGIPTTRALAAVSTGESVLRSQPLPGAVLTRVAASHLRVGTLQFFAARNDHVLLRRVADYAIARHDPDLSDQPDRYLQLLAAVMERQARLIAQWLAVGFIHGVMNTDNMTLSGETIDYGPCAFLEAYDPATVFSSIDTHGRYAYANQPGIAAWNLARLAEALLPLIDDDSAHAAEQANATLQGFKARYQTHHLSQFRAKLGLDNRGPESTDQTLISDYLGLLQHARIDFTLGFRALLPAAQGNKAALLELFSGATDSLMPWLATWQQRIGAPDAVQLQAMQRANPAYIPRNHQVEAALTAATEDGNLEPFRRLLTVLSSPFTERTEHAEFLQPAAPEQTACYQTFCGT